MSSSRKSITLYSIRDIYCGGTKISSHRCHWNKSVNGGCWEFNWRMGANVSTTYFLESYRGSVWTESKEEAQHLAEIIIARKISDLTEEEAQIASKIAKLAAIKKFEFKVEG